METSTDQTTLYFAVVRGILHSQQAEVQGAWESGEELLWGRQPESNKGKCLCDFRQLCLAGSQEAIRGSVLVVSGSCAFCYVGGYLSSVGVSTWDFWNPGELTVYFLLLNQPYVHLNC
jgi:hypothetical protein